MTMDSESNGEQPVVVNDYEIIDVWSENLEQEFRKISELVLGQGFRYVAMDTEFPGVVARPYGTFRSHTDYQYQTLKLNVDILRIIQLGVTLADENGNLAEPCCWQFHFKFSLSEDTFAQDSIDLLTTAGINFEKHQADGIDALEFGALLTTSGLVFSDDVKWISFHSYYDFGYLMKLLTQENLPSEELDFFDVLRIFFPCIYDIKYLMKSCETLKGGLNKVAEALQVRRVGPTHQAGSDSLVTCLTFFKMRRNYFDDVIDDSKYLGVLYGLGQGGQTAPVTCLD